MCTKCAALAFKDRLTRVGGCRGLFGDDGRCIGKRAGNRHAVPGSWEEILLAERMFDVSLGTLTFSTKGFSPAWLAGGRCDAVAAQDGDEVVRAVGAARQGQPAAVVPALKGQRGRRLCSSWLQRLRWLRLRRRRGPVARRFARRLRWLRWRLRNLLGMEPGFGPLDQPLLLTGVVLNGASFQPPHSSGNRRRRAAVRWGRRMMKRRRPPRRRTMAAGSGGPSFLGLTT